MDTKASVDIQRAMDWLKFPYNYKYQALEALDRAILELRWMPDVVLATVLAQGQRDGDP